MIEVVDSHTVRLNLPKSDITLIVGAADYPAAIVHKSYDNTAEGLLNSVGTGPYLPESLEVGVKAVLVKNENHKWWDAAMGRIWTALNISIMAQTKQLSLPLLKLMKSI